MPHRFIRKKADFQEFCWDMRSAERIALDTEFVAEDSYLPQLCLIQVALDGELAVVDPILLEGVEPFWSALVESEGELILHAGRGELEFCYRATGEFPRRVFDVQVAAGLCGAEYPAGYANLVNRLLQEKAGRHETRSDWRRRPLSERQVEYALDDVRYLTPMRDVLYEQLVAADRLGWLDEEIQRRNEEIRIYQRAEDRWRIAGNRSLSPRSLAIVRELWQWREARAARLNRPPRRILRDDLIVELARRQSAEVRHILAIRGLHFPRFRRLAPEIAECVRRALELPEEECPRPQFRLNAPHLPLLVQFLYAALGSVCREAGVSPGLVGSPNDVRSWLGYRLREHPEGELPLLAQGWRAELVGTLFDRLLSGDEAVRIIDPMADNPFGFVHLDSAAGDTQSGKSEWTSDTDAPANGVSSAEAMVRRDSGSESSPGNGDSASK